MTNPAEKLTEQVNFRVGSRLMQDLEKIALEQAVALPEVMRTAAADYVADYQRRQRNAQIDQLLERCATYRIDVKTVLETALVEEELSPGAHT